MELGRWLPVEPPRCQGICRRCRMTAVEDEQHFFSDMPLYKGIREQHTILLGSDQSGIRLFWERNADQNVFGHALQSRGHWGAGGGGVMGEQGNGQEMQLPDLDRALYSV